MFDEWHDTPGTVLYEAAKEGRVFDAATLKLAKLLLRRRSRTGM